MAAILLKPAGGNYGTGASWVGEAKPGAGDTPTLDDTSGGLVMDESTAALSGWNMTGYTGTVAISGLPARLIDVDGDLTIAGNVPGTGGSDFLYFEVTGNIDIAADAVIGDGATKVTITHNDAAANVRTIDTHGNTGQDKRLIINNNGVTSFTAQDKSYWDRFTLTAGKYDGGNFGVDVAGNIVNDVGNGVWTNSGKVTLSADGNLKNKNWSNPWAELECNAVGTIIDDDLYIKAISGSGSLAATAKTLNLWSTTTDNCWTLSGTCGAAANLLAAANISSGGGISLADKNLKISPTQALTFTMDGDISLGTGALSVEARTDGIGYLDMNGHRIDSAASAITLGDAADVDQKGGILFGSGKHKFTSLQAAAAGAAGNIVSFGNSFIAKLGGTILGIQGANEITVTSDDARIRGGTVTGVNCTGRLWCQPQTVTDGTGNSGDVLFRPKPDGIGCGIAA